MDQAQPVSSPEQEREQDVQAARSATRALRLDVTVLLADIAVNPGPDPRLAQLAAEVEGLKRSARTLLRLREVNWTSGEGLRVDWSGEIVTLLANGLAAFLAKYSAANLVEMTADHPDLGPLTVTVARKLGKSAMDLRTESERQAAQMRAALEAIRAVANPVSAGLEPGPVCIDTAVYELAEDALTVPAGKGWVRVRELEAVCKTLRDARGAIEERGDPALRESLLPDIDAALEALKGAD